MTDDKNTVRLHRVLRAPAERVYKAFLDPDALCRWLPPHGILATVDGFDANVGGGCRMSFANFGTGSSQSFTRTFVELQHFERIRYTDVFDDPNLPGKMEVVVELRAVICGTELSIFHSGIPEMIPAELCYLGWQEGLLQLANLVEPVILDGQ